MGVQMRTRVWFSRRLGLWCWGIYYAGGGARHGAGFDSAADARTDLVRSL